MHSRPAPPVVVVLATALAGCLSLTPIEDELADRPTSERWSRSGEAAVPQKWWEAFGDPELNELVARALEGNLDVKTALARLAQARALAGVASASLFPSVDAGLSYSDTRAEPAPAIPSPASSASLALSVSYELDLWGRSRHGARAAREAYEASAEDAKAAFVMVAANVATRWYEVVALREKLALLDEQRAVNEQYLDLLRLRFGQGAAAHAEVLQQEAQLLLTQSTISTTKTQLELREHALAVLVGRPPTDGVAGARDALPARPPSVAAGIPAEVLRRRPDVAAAEHRVRSAHASLGEAIAARFPRLSISASTTRQAEKLEGIFDNWVTSLVSNLLAPVFDGGRRRREADRNRAVVDERLAAYRKTVLTALREVEDALSREAGQEEFLRQLERRVSVSRQLVARQRARYLNGQTDYLPVVNALRSLQQLESSHIDARRNALVYRIDLYRALGGGWEALAGRPPGEK
jgi:NodT family efflux transporter outer membrane factor (OMF) lipoprotein